tara:strand:+ start:232665 stop:233603 length:939 start_codon:yes stop_codon:yes gene_type:complete
MILQAIKNKAQYTYKGRVIMGLPLKAYFEKQANASVNSLSKISHPACSNIALPDLTEADIGALTVALNKRIIQDCADDGIIMPADFKPVERLEVADRSELYWDTEGKEQRFLLENINVVMNLPLAFFHKDYPGHPFVEFDKTRYVESAIDYVLGAYDYQTMKSGATLNNGKKISLDCQHSEMRVNAPAALIEHFNSFEKLCGKDYTLVEAEDDYSFAPVLDIDLSGRPVVKLFYEVKDNMPNAQLEKLAVQALRNLDHHSDLYGVTCEPITIEMLRRDFEKLTESHVVNVKNQHYQENAPRKQNTLGLAPSI